MTEQEQQDSWAELGIRTDIPHPARVGLIADPDNALAVAGYLRSR